MILPCICPTCPEWERELVKSDVATSLTRLLLCIVLGRELLSSTACELLERDLVDLRANLLLHLLNLCLSIVCLFFGEVKNKSATKQMCITQGIDRVLCFLGCCEVCESETASAAVHLLGHTYGTQLPVSTKQ